MVELAVPVRQYMTSPVFGLAPAASIREAADLLRRHDVSSLAVCTGDTLVGVISRTDLLRVGRHRASETGTSALLDLPDTPVSAAMAASVATVDVGATVAQAAAVMAAREFHRVFVVDGDRLAGVLSTRDVMRALCDHRVTGTIADIMSAPVFSVDADATIAVAAQRLERAGISGLVVVENDWPVGVFTQIEALHARRLSADMAVEDVMDAAFVCMPEQTTIHRAAAQATALKVRRIIAVQRRDVTGVLTGIDFARVAAGC